MNSLSWMLYGINVVSSLGFAVAMVFVLALAAVVGLWIAAAARLMDCRREDEQAVRDSRNMWSIRFVWVAMALLAPMVIIPDKSTMYAIAASEVGERIAKTEAVSGLADDATKAVRQWIQNQLKEPSK